MQTTDNIDFIDYDKYDESDLDVRAYFGGRGGGKAKSHFEAQTKHYYFPYQDSQGNEQELITHVECLYRVTHGTFSPTEDSDWDFRGYTDLVSWDVLQVENNKGDEVDPEKVLTPEQFLEYSQVLDSFIGD